MCFEEIFSKKRDQETRGRKELRGANLTSDLKLQPKDKFVRIVHAGGREELYRNAITVSKLLEKYPGMCVARPGVFQSPSQSFLWPDEDLLPGHKYYMIPSTTAKKMKRDHHKGRIRRTPESKLDTPDARITWEASEDQWDVSVRSAQDFYTSKERRPGISKRREPRGKKLFVPPLPKGRVVSQGFGWEPSLTSVKELSP